MRHLLCKNCGGDKETGITKDDQYAEITRITWGIAKQPTGEQRVVHVNYEVMPLSPDFYNCDMCYAKIKPGDRCCAMTVWQAGRASNAIAYWEGEYLEKDQ